MNFFKKQYNILKQGFVDVKNYFLWKKTIKNEISRYKSEFVTYDLNVNKSFTSIHKFVDMPVDYEKEKSFSDKFYYLVDVIKPINNYLKNKLGWGEYLTYRFYKIEDPDNANDVVYTYLVVWYFRPIRLTSFSFWRNLIILLGLIAVLFGFLGHAVYAALI